MDGMEEDDDIEIALPMEVWPYVQYDYRKVPLNFNLVSTDACSIEVGKQRWLRLYGRSLSRKSPAAVLLTQALDAYDHSRAVERAFCCPWIATRISSFIDRRQAYATLSSLSLYVRRRLIGDALKTATWLSALRACRPCTSILLGDDVATAGLRVIYANASTKYVGLETRLSTAVKVLIIVRIKRGRSTHVESAICIEKDAESEMTCRQLVGKRASLDIVASKSGKQHLYIRLISPSSKSQHFLPVTTVGISGVIAQ